MNLTTKGRYAVMAMVDIAAHECSGPVSLAEVAVRQGIALSYLEQIFVLLRKSGLVKSVRGPGGGYVILEEIENISISSIIIAVDETIKITRCGNSKEKRCGKNNAKCTTHDLWVGLSNKIYEYLDSVTLADVSNQQIPEATPFLARKFG